MLCFFTSNKNLSTFGHSFDILRKTFFYLSTLLSFIDHSASSAFNQQLASKEI